MNDKLNSLECLKNHLSDHIEQIKVFTLKNFFILFFLFLPYSLSGAHSSLAELPYLSDSLKQTLSRKKEFVERKIRYIDSLKSMMRAETLTLDGIYQQNLDISDSYAKFNVDSALLYVSKAEDASRILQKENFRILACLKRSRLLSLCGRFREAETILKEVNPQRLDENMTIEYYDSYNVFEEYYAITFPDSPYCISAYKDSLYNNLPQNSYRYKVNQAALLAGVDTAECKKAFIHLFKEIKPGSPEFAMLANHYASIIESWGARNEAKKYYTLSAITDIRNATRETLSLQRLAKMEYEEGNVEDAFIYASGSLDDVVSSGISLRAREVYNFLNIITDAYRANEEQNKNRLRTFIFILCVSLGMVGVLAVFLRIQMKKLMVIKKELAETNSRLSRINGILNQKNGQLLEANEIKEEYISQFFDVCFCFIKKMERSRSVLYKLFCSGSYNELGKRLKPSYSVSEDLKELYSRFDSVFLTLYPFFVEDFNSLMRDEGKVAMKTPGILNREMRIYALMRLGISDSAKIAEFLNCPVSTVYSYRTRVRNKAQDRDTFEARIMETRAIHDL